MELFNIYKFLKIADASDIFRLVEFFIRYNKNYSFILEILGTKKKKKDKYYFDKIIGKRKLNFLNTKKNSDDIDQKHNYKADFILKHLPSSGPDTKSSNTIKILDFGCGDCTLGASFSKFFNSSKCWGCDVQDWSEFSDNNRKRNSLCEFTPIAENQKLPYEDNFFHFIIVSHVLHHVKNRDFVLRELRRILSQDGFLIVLEHDSVDNLDKYIIEAHHVLYMYISNPSLFSYNEQKQIRYFSDYISLTELRDTTQKLGFDTVSCVFESKSTNKLELKILRQYLLFLKIN